MLCFVSHPISDICMSFFAHKIESSMESQIMHSIRNYNIVPLPPPLTIFERVFLPVFLRTSSQRARLLPKCSLIPPPKCSKAKNLCNEFQFKTNIHGWVMNPQRGWWQSGLNFVFGVSPQQGKSWSGLSRYAAHVHKHNFIYQQDLKYMESINIFEFHHWLIGMWSGENGVCHGTQEFHLVWVIWATTGLWMAGCLT